MEKTKLDFDGAVMPLPADTVADVALGLPIPEAKLAFFRDRLKDRLFVAIAKEMNRQEMAGRTSIAELALRIGKGTNEFDQLLATPDAWRLEDYMDVIPALCGAALDVRLVPVDREIA